MKKQKTIKALDDIAMSYIHGEIEPVVIWSLCPVDQITVLSFINIYSSCLQGFMSRESCKAAKLKIMSQHELLSSRISWSETIYCAYIGNVKEAGTKTCDMVKAIKANEPLKALQYSIEALDIYQGGNIYLQMFFGRGIKTNSLAEINQTNAKCVYCECEFHDNATLAKWIVNNTTKIGEAIAKGLCSAFGVTYKSAAKVLDSQGYKKGQTSDGVLAIKELLLLAKTLKIHNQGMDENGGFGNGTKKAVNGLLKKWGYDQNGIAGDNFIKKLTAEIGKKI